MANARQLVLGTAGHIDHGKTSLVRALTGIDTDRLPEEKRRGITIELGFARWQPNDDVEFGIVDVPGHEALVRTMVAGAGGVDAALIVIAAEDGVMPQTREHLHVCQLLGLRHAVVALTKIDRLRTESNADEYDELIELMTEDVRETLEGGPFAEASIIPVSAHTGENLEELRDELVALARRVPGRGRKGVPILPIDRVFTMRGHGTVITGTLIEGEVDLDVHPELKLVPGGDGREPKVLRVRGMQVHGREAKRSRAGTRTALALGKVSVDELARGDVLSLGDKVVRSDRILAVIEQLGFGLRPWARDTTLQLCAGTASSLAHIVPLALEESETGELSDPMREKGKPKIGPGQRGLARIYLDPPLPIWAGQRVILREFSAGHAALQGLTVGGGVIVDPRPERRLPHRRVALARALLSDDPGTRTLALIEDAGAAGIDRESLAIRGAIPEPGKILARLTRPGGEAIAVSSDRWVARSILEDLVGTAAGSVDEFHKRNPLQPGIARATLEGSLPGHPSPELTRATVDLAIDRGLLRVADRAGSLARPGKGSLDPEHLPRDLQIMVDMYRRGEMTPPTLKQVAERLGVDQKQVLEYASLLQHSGLLVRISDNLSWARETHVELLGKVREYLAEHGLIDVQALKTMTGMSRKFAVPFMEHLDHLAITRRVGDRRIPGPKAEQESG